MDTYSLKTTVERTAREQSVAAERLVVEEAADGRKAKIEVRLAYNDEAFMEVHEVVEVDGQGVPQPISYSFSFVEDGGVRHFRLDLDSRHEPAAHLHRAGSPERHPFKGVSLKQAIELGWEATSQAAESEARSGPPARVSPWRLLIA